MPFVDQEEGQPSVGFCCGKRNMFGGLIVKEEGQPQTPPPPLLQCVPAPCSHVGDCGPVRNASALGYAPVSIPSAAAAAAAAPRGPPCTAADGGRPHQGKGGHPNLQPPPSCRPRGPRWDTAPPRHRHSVFGPCLPGLARPKPIPREAQLSQPNPLAPPPPPTGRALQGPG